MDISGLPSALLPWYWVNRRDLPWRQTRDPYRIWLSEIMLQQTRVEAVKGYYARFLEALPDIAALAACDDSALLKLWEGLGYYSRARNLKKAAKVILEQYDGVFPKSYDAVRKLPGIGEYTAGAICSIAFDLPTPAVDGNVLRLYARLTDDPTPIDAPSVKKEVRNALSEIYPQNAGDFTQALIELGATLCGPNQKPQCDVCPCKSFCRGYAHGTADTLPVKSPKKAKRQEEKTVFILRCGNCYALEKRPASGLLASLWQFPNVNGQLSTSDALCQAERWGLHPREVRKEVFRKHVFTHIIWNMKGIYLEVSQMAGSFRWFTEEQINTSAALPTAFRLFWEEERDV